MRKGGQVVSESERTPSKEVIAKLTPQVHADMVRRASEIKCKERLAFVCSCDIRCVNKSHSIKESSMQASWKMSSSLDLR